MKNAQQFGSPDATVVAPQALSGLSGVASVAEMKGAITIDYSKGPHSIQKTAVDAPDSEVAS